MRQLLIAAAGAAAALALASCDPRELVVQDNSALERITIEVSNDSPKWDYGEQRLFTIVPTPNTAIISEYGLSFSDPDLVEMVPGDLPNQFKVFNYHLRFMGANDGEMTLGSAVKHRYGANAAGLFDMIGKYDKPIKRPKNPAIDRAFRRLIQEANMSGDCIINLGEGYFRPGKDDYVDLAEYLLKEQARATEIISKCVSMRQAYNRRYL